MKNFSTLPALCTSTLLLLLLLHPLGLLEALCPLALLLGLGGIGGHGCAHLILGNEESAAIGLQDSDQQ